MDFTAGWPIGVWSLIPDLGFHANLRHVEMPLISTRQFAISSRAEAQEYSNHPVLGPRLRQCTELVNLVKERSIDEIFGYPDNLKFHASIN
jgi:uncharacterized protein (DUF1810 family)